MLGAELSSHIRTRFAVEYVTIQIEGPTEACGAPPSRYREETDGAPRDSDHEPSE
jgi:hypothetical protein